MNFGITPELLKIVECSAFFLENVGDNVHVIEQNPLPVQLPFLVPGVLFTHLIYFFFHGGRNSINLRVGSAGTQDKKITDRILNITQVHYHDVLSFLFLHSPHDKVADLFGGKLITFVDSHAFSLTLHGELTSGYGRGVSSNPCSTIYQLCPTNLNNLLYKIYPKTLFCGQIRQYLPSCQSTNDEASALLVKDNAPEGLVVVTDNQMAGRGQRGNVWLAQPGQNLTFSLILKPSFLTATEQFWLNIAVSLGVYDALQPLIGVKLRVKWPNDMYAGSKKLGGMLIENTLHGYHIAASVVGIGLNINPNPV